MSDKAKNIVVVVSFFVLLLGVLLLNLIKPDTEISLSERRKLAKFPEITVKKLLDGSSSKEFEKYTTDQIIQREEFRKLKSVLEFLLFGKKDNNGIYSYQNKLIEIEYPLNEKSVLNVANKINEIQKTYFNNNKCYYAIVPDKNYFTNQEEYIRMDYDKLEQLMKDKVEMAEYIPIWNCLRLEDYYVTDIHWKQENLQKVVEKISKEMGFYDKLKTSYQKETVIEFEGLYAGQIPTENAKDEICILTNEITQNASVYHYENGKETQVYDKEKLTSNDKYDIYLSGSTPLITINNSKARTQKELIIFRDSFGSSLAPLLLEGYSKITLVDIRYMRSQDISKYIEINGQEDVLFLYSTLVLNNSSILK